VYKFMTRIAAAVPFVVASSAAFARPEQPPVLLVPEPGVLELVALAGVVGWAVRKLRK
jgi:hypothetical protein